MTITPEIFAKIKQLVKKNPKISNPEIARQLNISRDCAERWRDRESFPVSVDTCRAVDLSIAEEHKLVRENKQLKKQVKDLLDERELNTSTSGLLEELSGSNIKIPRWRKPSSGKGKDYATVCAFASDWHLDEVVNESQVSGVNKFDRKIAEIRCDQFFDNTIRLVKHFVGGIEFDGVYLMLGGDMFSGNIHEELKETNESTIIESVLHWTPRFISGIRYLADTFGRVHIPCVVGNHGRLTRKPAAKNRVQDNFDFLFYSMLAMQLKDDERITWDISPAADCRFSIHETDFLLTHGDQFKGGSGIAGMLSPLMLGDARKRKRQAAVRQPYDWMVFGHWHSLVLGVRGLIGNGSLKGYDEYASISNFDFEPPQQALWLVQPKWGVTGRWPIHVLGEDESY